MTDLREAARRALQSLNDLIADSSDPGVEALGAQYELQLALVGGTAVHVDLRDRLRRAICEAEGFAWDDDGLEPDEYGEVADAVLAVLPAPVGRAAVLREAADDLEAWELTPSERWSEAEQARHEDGIDAAADRLRRLADEAQQPEQFTEAERGFLAYALHLADEQMVTGGGRFSDADRAALVMFQRLAKAGCTCDHISESWVEMPHAANCPMAEQCPGCGHDRHVGFCVTPQPTGAQGKPEECGCLDSRHAEGAQR